MATAQPPAEVWREALASSSACSALAPRGSRPGDGRRWLEHAPICIRMCSRSSARIALRRCAIFSPATRRWTPASSSDVPETALEAGTRFGAYQLERQVGIGGMGEVWLARRIDGRFEGAVALKVLHAHVAQSAARERFVREGRILGQLSHPHIARLLDAGATSLGVLYFVLEYVEGKPIDQWCDERNLDVPARLHLFLQVCDAVAHAHTHLVIHRDLKPPNILVTHARRDQAARLRNCETRRTRKAG